MKLKNNRNRILIIGAGAMGRAAAYELLRWEPRIPLAVIDKDNAALRQLTELTGEKDVVTFEGDASNRDLVARSMSDSIVAIGAASYRLNLELTNAAIDHRVSWVDLGGNNTVVRQQFNLDSLAGEAGVAIVPDCGLAPGIVNIIGGDVFNRLDRVDELHFRVGGLPQQPKPPLYYGLIFSPEGLINEYIEPTRSITDGEIVETPALTGWEKVHVGPPFGTLEAFHTSGGASTMVDTFADKVKHLDYKTLRYAGHLRRIKLLADIGLFGSEHVDIDHGLSISPRTVMETLLSRLGWIKEDVVVLKAWAVGEKGNKRKRLEYTMIDYYDPESGLTAMARTTAFSAAVVARMIIDGRIKDTGVLRQESTVPAGEFFKELRLRGINMDIVESEIE